MSRLGIFIADGCEEVEALTVVDIVRRAKLEIDMISINGTKQVTSSRNVTFMTDTTKEEADFSAYDGIILPGGMPGTFHLMNHYLGNGCEEYTFWNPILADEGVSPWGWKQNALIRVDSKQAKAIFTPEYYAVKHYTRFLMPGTKVLAFKPTGEDKKPVLK